MEKPAQRPEGALLDTARRALKLSARAAAELAGMSDARWRNIVSGYQSAGRGQYIAVSAPPETLARMAQAVGVSAKELFEVGRMDAYGAMTAIWAARPGEEVQLDQGVPQGSDEDPAHGVAFELAALVERVAAVERENARLKKELGERMDVTWPAEAVAVGVEEQDDDPARGRFLGRSDLGKESDQISEEHDLAARSGIPDLSGVLERQDRAGEAPDDEGPEGGA
jgi:transcriptional regulator with XRE-family HTH domain